MEGWPEKADRVRDLALAAAKNLRGLEPNHRLLKLLGELKRSQAIINLYMNTDNSWHAWPISRVLAVAYAKYFRDLRQALNAAEWKEPEAVAQDPFLIEVEELFAKVKIKEVPL